MTAAHASGVPRARADAEALGGDYYPDCWLQAPSRSPGRLYGIADVHAHPMAHLAFGGRALWGKPGGPPEIALASCKGMHGRFALSVAALTDGWRRHPGGYPDFRSWPTFDGMSHQQMHIDWIRRAHQGGLRLMVALVVNNEFLARITGGRQPWDDATAIDVQISWMKAFAARYRDLLEIAYSPADARRIIGSDRLAVVLGVEVDSLIESAPGQPPEDWLEHLYETGVRHVFPIHLIDNMIGGSALYHPVFDILNRWMRGTPFETRAASGVEFQLANMLWRTLAGRSPLSGRRLSRGHGEINAFGLSPLGRDVVLPALMRLGMIVDIDHMSAACVAQTLDIFEQHAYPVVCGHAAFRQLALDRRDTSDLRKVRNEYQRSDEELERIRGVGGLVAVGWVQRDLRAHTGFHRVANDAAASAKSWAQAYLYALEHSGDGRVALGTDSNGAAGAPGPRFGRRAASGLERDSRRLVLRPEQVAAQRDGVHYDDDEAAVVLTREHPPLTMCRTGRRAFDINVDGVAHYGLMPDFLQDLRNVGVTPDLLEPLFSSAEAYISLWERVHRSSLRSQVPRSECGSMPGAADRVS